MVDFEIGNPRYPLYPKLDKFRYVFDICAISSYDFPEGPGAPCLFVSLALQEGE